MSSTTRWSGYSCNTDDSTTSDCRGRTIPEALGMANKHGHSWVVLVDPITHLVFHKRADGWHKVFCSNTD